jgi:TPR repeat protein
MGAYITVWVWVSGVWRRRRGRYKKAAEQGNVNAQCSLGACYLHGEGVPRDKRQAISWLKKAAVQGDASAQVTD